MKTPIFIMALFLASASCDYKEYPQEQEWKENLKDDSREKMEKQKEQDPRKLDDVMEQEQDHREVKIESSES